MDKFSEWLVANKDIVTSWTAILAVVASTVSFVVAILNMKWQRIHYRKTLFPIGNLSLGDYEDAIFVRLRNDGAGPMIVDQIAVFRNGTDERIGSALIELMPQGVRWTTFVNDIAGRAFTPGKDIDLISMKGDEKDPKFVAARLKVREALSKLSVRVYYHSVYGDKKYVQRQLDWFGRHLTTNEVA